MNVLVFLPNWVGDTVMCTPALRAIREQFPEARLVGVLRPHIADVLSGLPWLDEQILLPVPGKGFSLPAVRVRELWSCLRLRRKNFDLAVLFPNSFRSALLARVAGARRRVGFARDGRTWLLTDPVQPKPRQTPHPVIDEYLRLAEHLGCKNLSRAMELATTPEDDRKLTSFLLQQGVRSISRLVCLNPGGAYGAAKHWPTEYFAELARRIAVELHRTVLVLCGPAERNTARRIVQSADHPAVISLAQAPVSIGLTKAAVRIAELLVTTDSGPRHFAPPFNVPVITLFGPTHIQWSETFYNRAVHLQVPVPCGPCQKRTCPEGHHRCMRELTPAMVFEHVQQILQGRIPAAA